MTFLAGISGRLIKVRADLLGEEIGDALREIVELFGVDRCSLTRITSDGNLSVIGSYAVAGVPSAGHGETCVQLPWYCSEMAHGRVVRCSQPADLPRRATSERGLMRDSGIKSLVGIPISFGEISLYAINATMFRRRITLTDEVITTLQLAGEILASAVARGEMQGRLRRIEAELSHVTRVATVGQLAASIAHEINQPLCAIVSNTNAAQRLLKQGKTGLAEVRDALRDIAADSKRAGAIVSCSHQLLKPSLLTLQPIDLNQVVRDAAMLLHGEIVLRHLRMRIELQENLLPVAGDPVQLQQVMLNLLVNAADAAALVPGREREVAIRSEIVDGQVCVKVSDNGIGLTPDVAARMFDPFFTTKSKGLGMGLAINRTIVEAHQGRIWAVANPDHGTTVAFCLPACAEHPQERKCRP